MACSVYYALIAQCDEVIANPDAIVGSIGCCVALTDVSKAMEMEGVKRIFITSGSNKVPFRRWYIQAQSSFKNSIRRR